MNETPSSSAAQRRTNTEQALRLIFDDLIQQHPDLHIRVLSDSRIAGQAGADVLVQVDDYELRLVLLDAADEPRLTLEQLAGFRAIFEANPSTETLILTWTTGDLKSERLNLNRTEYLLEHPERLDEFVRGARPLQELAGQVLDTHMKVSDSVADLAQSGGSSPGDLQLVFDKHMQAALHNERDRSYKTEAKKQAAWKFPEARELALLREVMKDALQGAPADDLAQRLAQLPRRGGR